MIYSAIIKELIAAGVSGDALVAAVERIEAAGEPAKTPGAERQARYRERHKALQSVTSDDTKPSSETTPLSSSNLLTVILPKDPPKEEGPKGKVFSFEAGRRAVEVLSSLRDLPDSAAALQRSVAAALEADGFEVFLEVPTAGLGDERPGGRIDILAKDGPSSVAIELDARSPRRRSVLKLKLFDAFRIVGLRGVGGDCPPGIDAVVKLNVRQASEAERRDKSQRKAGRLPDDFQPDLTVATSLGMLPDEAAHEAAQFVDYWHSKGAGATKLDWHIAWRMWCRRTVQTRRGSNGNSAGRSGRELPHDTIFRALAEVAANGTGAGREPSGADVRLTIAGVADSPHRGSDQASAGSLDTARRSARDSGGTGEVACVLPFSGAVRLAR